MKKRFFAAMLVAVCLLGALCGCSKRDRRVVGSCAGYDVFYEELRFVTLSARTESEGLDAGALKEAVANQIALDYAVLVAAKAYFSDLSLEDAEIQKAVDASVDAAIEEYGSKSKYKAFLKENNLTESYARLLLARAEVELKWKEKLETDLFTGTSLEDETAFAAWLQDGNLVRARRIVAPSEAVAQEIRAALLAGASPEGAVQGKEGANLSAKFYLVKGYSEDQELEADAFALTAESPVGEIRAVNGEYRLLIREEIGAEDAESFAAYQLPTYLQNLRKVKYEAEREKILSDIVKNNPFLLNEFGNSLDLTTIK